MRQAGWNSLIWVAYVCALGAVVLVLAVSAGVGSMTHSPAVATEDSAPEGAFQTDIDADSILMEATVDGNGDADWRVVYRLELEDSDSITAFEELQADIEENTSAYLDPFEERIQRTVGTARNVTTREMVGDGFTVSTRRDSQPDAEFGLVVFEFEWSNFAAVEDDGATLRMGDAVDRLFLDEGTSLRFEWPDAYQLASQTPSTETVSEGRITWTGPLEFDSGEPRVLLTTEEATTTPTGTAGGTATATPGGGDTATDDATATAGSDSTETRNGASPGDSDSGENSILLLFAVAAIALVAAVVVAAKLRDDETPAEAASGADEEDDESDAGSGGLPPELLSNEERVMQLLDEEGGRMKQKEVAERLDWTAAKTSQVVGDLRDEDEVEAFRLGRENVLTLPDVDLEDSGGGTESDDDEQ